MKHANGAIQSLHKLEGSDEYRSVMRQCLKVIDNGAHKAILGSAYSEPWSKNLNKHHVETLAAEIGRLIDPIQAEGSNIEKIAISIPTSYSNFIVDQAREAMSSLHLPLTSHKA